MTSAIKSAIDRSPFFKRLYYKFTNLTSGIQKYYPWEDLIKPADIVRNARNTKGTPTKVLVATCSGGHLAAINFETLIAATLTLRGAKVRALLCDHFLPACLLCEIGLCTDVKRFSQDGPQRTFCRNCFTRASKMYESVGIHPLRFSDYIEPQEAHELEQIANTCPVEAIPGFKFRDLSVGEHAMAGALRFFARGSLEGAPHEDIILRRYFKAALLTAVVMLKIQSAHHFDAALFHHGIYVPHGIIGEVCRSTGVRVVNWNIGYRRGTFIFSHGHTYHHTMMTESVRLWEPIQWDPDLEKRVMDYIGSRSRGARDWHVYLEAPSENISTLGIRSDLPAIGLLTNVCWDAQLHYPANMFKDMLEWIRLTIAYFTNRTDLQLVIRVHPAEVTADIPSRQSVAMEVKKAFPDLPANIIVVPPQNMINTYALMDRCDSAIIYGTKTGVELTSLGIPTIVAGEAWIKNKGITEDPPTREDYFRILDKLPFNSKMSSANIQRARKYAYHFFFRRMIPVEVIRPTNGWPPFQIQIERLTDLLPGLDAGLDVICNGVLSATEFIYPDENFRTWPVSDPSNGIGPMPTSNPIRPSAA